MTTPTGTISLSDVNTELGYSSTALITMNDAAVRTLAGVGGSGTIITMQNLQGKSNRVTANITISSDTANYTLNTAKVTGYSAGKTDVTLTINSGVVVYSGSTGSYAFTVDTSWAAGDTVTIVNNGTILGKGGNGGTGGYWLSLPGTNGSSAGPAINIQRATSINNLNRIAGGGGGGGGGNGARVVVGKNAYGGSGGGGGGGIGNGSGGAGSPYLGAGSGSSGTLTSAGSGGSPGGEGGYYGGSGGTGGGYGSSGSSGGGGAGGGQGAGGGGAAGAAVNGNSNITWINTGTRNGSIS